MKKLIIMVAIMALMVSTFAEPKDRAEVDREIAILNGMLELHNATWTAGVTSVSFLDDADMQQMLGLVAPEITSREEFVVNAEEWPTAGMEFIVDNVTAVKNQAQCGSCVAFGSTAAFEQTYWKKNGAQKLFSERYLFFCSPYPGYGCNSGWSLNGGAAAIANSSKGIVESAQCPYYDGSYHYDCGNGCTTTAKKYSMPYTSVNGSSFIAALKKQRAVIIGMTVFADFRNYKTGIYEHLEGSRLGGHCMVLVGYGTTKEGKHYWVIKNSWASTWGDQGYIRLLVKPEQKYKDSNIEDWGGYYFE